MADKRNRTPFYGAVPTSKLQADHVFMADGTSVQADNDAIHDYLNREFELIEEITLTEDAALIDRNTTPADYSGGVKSYDFDNVYIQCETTTGSANANLLFRVNGTYTENLIALVGSGISNTYAKTFSHLLIQKRYGLLTAYCTLNGTNSLYNFTQMVVRSSLSFTSTVNRIIIAPSTGNIPAGSVIKIYATWKQEG